MAYDEITARDAWRYAREQAALLLDTDLTTSEVTEAAMNLAAAFRDLDTGTVTGTPVGGRAKAKLEDRAESCAETARQFAGPEHAGEAQRWYIAYYRTMADELRKVAASL